LDDTERGDQGFRTSDTTMDQEVKGQKAKARMEINQISAGAFGQFYRSGETIGILRLDKIEDEIHLEGINISTELAMNNKKNNKDQDVRDTVSREYHHLLDVFEKGEKTTVLPHRTGIDLGIDLEEGKTEPIKRSICPELRPIGGTPPIHQTERRLRMDPNDEVRKGFADYICQEKGCQTQTWRRLSGAQRSYQEGSTPATAH